MDFGELLHTAQKNEKHKSTGGTGSNYYKARFDPPKKEEKQKTLSANIQKFLAKKEEEERRKAQEDIRKRDELLAMRDPKATKKIQKMLKVIKSANKSVLNDAIDTEHTAITRDGPIQPDQDDYGYESQEAAAIYKKMMEKYSKMPVEEKFPPSASGAKGDLLGTRDRVRAALLRQQEEEAGPHRRQRKSHKDTEAIDTPDDYKAEKKVEKQPEKKVKRPPPPVMDFNELLRIAEEKKSQPVIGVAPPKPSQPTGEPERLMTKRQRREYEEECARRDARLRRQQQRAQHEADRKEENHGSESKPSSMGTFNRIPKLSQKGSTNDQPARNGYTENHQTQPSMTSVAIKSSRPDRPNNNGRTNTTDSHRGRPNISNLSKENTKSNTTSFSNENSRPSTSNTSRENERSYSPSSTRKNNGSTMSDSHRENNRTTKAGSSKENGKTSISNSSRENKNPYDKNKSNSNSSSEAKVRLKDHREISSEKSKLPCRNKRNNDDSRNKSEKLGVELTKPKTNENFNRGDKQNYKKDGKEYSQNNKNEISQQRRLDIPREKDFNPFRNNNYNGSNERKLPPAKSSDSGKSNTADRSSPKINGQRSSNQIKPGVDNNPFRTKQITDMKSKHINSLLDKSRHLPSSDAKARQSLQSDARPKQQTDTKSKQVSDAKSRQFPPSDVRSRQLPPAETKSRQFPPADVKSRQFPPNDTRRFPPQDMRRKDRPALKRRVIGSESEYDSELEDFIDDGPEEDQDYSKYIKEIFGYDKNKYRGLDEDDANMESTFAQQMREEYISKKIGIQEDLDDMRMEAMEKKNKQKRRRIDDDDD